MALKKEEPKPKETVSLSKVVKGNPDKDSTFKFKLTAGKDGYPMPSGSKANTKETTVKGSGKADFGEITFTEAGIYTYKVTEENTKIKNYVYDDTVYTVTYVVTDANGKLTVEKVISNKTNDVSKIVFTNTYSEIAKPNEGDNPKDTGNGTLRVTKYWDDNHDSREKRPDSIKVKLYKNGSFTGKVITLKASSDWTGKFTKLDNDTSAYRVKEEAVTDYSAWYSRMKNEFTIKNTYTKGVTDPDGNWATPKTGDVANMIPYILLMIVAFAAIAGTFVYRRKQKNE